MRRILLFGFTGFSDRMRANDLKRELEKQDYECFIIEPPCYGLTIGEIVAVPETSTISTSPEDEKLPEPFILFCGMMGETLDLALGICKGNTRAILTDSNTRMTALELSAHLLEEKRSIEKAVRR